MVVRVQFFVIVLFTTSHEKKSNRFNLFLDNCCQPTPNVKKRCYNVQ